MARIEDEPALVLHTRPYRETSLLVDLLTARHGRVAALLKGGRHRLPVFSTFMASWYGGRELVTLVSPSDVNSPWLQGDATSAGLYMNELIVRLVGEREPVGDLFALACWALDQFQQGADIRPVLRSFEKVLLETLGYGLSFRTELHHAEPIKTDRWYQLVGTSGFELIEAAPLSGADQARGFVEQANRLLISGRLIYAIAEEQFTQGRVNAAAKRLFRRCLLPLLGDRPLKSRELLLATREQAS